MRKIFEPAILLVSLFTLCVSLCAGQPGIIRGIVNGADGPLRGATVSAGKITTTTNDLGQFSITLSDGNYTLHITHIGYDEFIAQIILKAGDIISFDCKMNRNEKTEQMVMLGSHIVVPRSNLTSAVPVDVISSKQLLQTSQTVLTQMLQFTVPSFNASRQLVNEPVTLRGLDPDQVLILVNGKRYHNMSVVNFGGVRGILGRGAVSNDLNSIPSPAIEKIEVLRDGASAQYGSDAIAGVINIQLRNSPDQASAQLFSGQFYKADGETIGLGINKGCKFLRKGFLNFAANFRFQNPTYRGGIYRGTVYLPIPANASHDDSIRIRSLDDSIVRARSFDRAYVTNAGSSKHSVSSLSLNGGYPIHAAASLYWTIVVNHRSTVFISGFTFPKNANRVNFDLFPDGFKSLPYHHTADIFAIVGIKGETTSHWHWDASSAFGNNKDKYHNKQTNNASQSLILGKNAPTSFYTGSFWYGQLTNNVEFSKGFWQATHNPSNLVLGAEWRIENDRLKAGEEGSWKTYDTTGRKLGGSGGLVLSPQDAVKANRNVSAAYAEVESEFLNRLLINMAGRYEYYSDFGGNLAGKLAARFKLSDDWALRGSLGNGFRAPSLQQNYYSQTRINVSTMAGSYTLLTSGIFRNKSAVAKALGIPPLGAENSLNAGGGLTGELSRSVRLTVDAYWIQIKNRIVLSGVFDRTLNRNVDSLLQGVTQVSQVQFFVNAINTRTKGLDIVLNGAWQIKKSSLLVMFGANFTKTRLFGETKAAGNLKADSLNTNTLFNLEERTRIEHGQPENKIILALTYNIGKIELLIRNTRFGKTSIAPAYSDPKTRVTSFAHESFSPKILTDISLTYSPTIWLSATLSANNIFDVYPDRLEDYRNTFEGTYMYAQEATPFGFNGGYYFIRMQINL